MLLRRAGRATAAAPPGGPGIRPGPLGVDRSELGLAAGALGAATCQAVPGTASGRAPSGDTAFRRTAAGRVATAAGRVATAAGRVATAAGQSVGWRRTRAERPRPSEGRGASLDQ